MDGWMEMCTYCRDVHLGAFFPLEDEGFEGRYIFYTHIVTPWRTVKEAPLFVYPWWVGKFEIYVLRARAL